MFNVSAILQTIVSKLISFDMLIGMSLNLSVIIFMVTLAVIFIQVGEFLYEKGWVK